MIRYRKSQKEFAFPLIGAALKGGKLLGGLERAQGLIFTGSSVAGMFQGAKGNKMMQQQNAEMERANRAQQKIEQQRLEQEKKWQEQQLKLQKQALKKGVNPFGDSSILNNTTGTPTTPLQPPPPIAQGNFSKNDLEEKQKDFSVFSFAKDMALLASRNRGLMINGVLAGAATTAGVYSVDRAIREDKKRKDEKFIDNGEPSSNRNDYNKFTEKSFSRRRVSLKAPVFSFALGAAAPAISYATEKKLEKEMLNDTTISHEDSISPKFKEKSFAAPLSATGKVLNAVSIMAGGGGAKGMRRLGIQISAIGKKSGNKATKKLGEAILKNPNTSMALSIPGGLAILGGTFTIGDKIATKIAKEVDPDAFKYVESKEKEVE